MKINQVLTDGKNFDLLSHYLGHKLEVIFTKPLDVRENLHFTFHRVEKKVGEWKTLTSSKRGPVCPRLSAQSPDPSGENVLISVSCTFPDRGSPR